MSLPYHGWTHLPKAMGGTDPIPYDPPLEWTRVRHNGLMSLGTTFTKVTLDTISGTGFNGSSTPPTFAVNGDDNIEIGIQGLYSIEIRCSNFSLSPGVDTVLWLQMNQVNFVGGNSVVTWAPGSIITNPWESVQALRMNHAHTDVDDDSDVGWSLPVQFSLHFAIVSTNPQTAVELELEALVEEDEVGVAHTALFDIFLSRHGRAYG